MAFTSLRLTYRSLMRIGLDNTRQTPRILRQLEHKVYPIRKTVEEMSKTDEQVDRMATISSKQTAGLIGYQFPRYALCKRARTGHRGSYVHPFALLFSFLGPDDANADR